MIGGMQQTARSWTAMGSVLLVVTAIALSAALVRAVELGPVPHVVRRSAGTPSPARSAIELAGSGSNLPLVRALVAAFEARVPGAPLRVHPSIGSGGGLRALRDGVIDAALISRPLAAQEQVGLRVRKLARVPVVLATSQAAAAVAGISSAALIALYAGTLDHFPDGTPALVVQREAGDSAHLAVANVLPGFAAVDRASRRRARFPVVRSDADMQRALLDNPHAVGLFDLGLIRSQSLPLHAVAIEGTTPGLSAVRLGHYPFARDLAIAVHTEPPPRLADFLDFLASEAAEALCRRLGYLAPGAQ